MSELTWSVAAAVFVTSVAAAALFRFLWYRFFGSERTPTGFGVLLPAAMLAGVTAGGASPAVMATSTIIAAGALAYFTDDAVELSARIRIWICLAAGALIGWLLGSGSGLYGAQLLLVSVAAALTLLILTQVTNFYDGADLNLATHAGLTLCFLLVLQQGAGAIASMALSALAFIAAFAVFNRKPRTLYLGDAGSFSFACFLTFLLVLYVLGADSIPPEAALPSALPLLDVVWVFAFRVLGKHDLLTRNWLHLYQQIQLRVGGHFHLLPQLINAALCLAAALLFQQAGMSRFAAVVLAGVSVTVPFYFALRKACMPDGKLLEPQSRD